MIGKKIHFVSSEVIPYLPNNDISSLSYNLPKWLLKMVDKPEFLSLSME